ncbi:MAG: BrnT family toxin [Deltaproteobacteria bacterium]|nr:BrnT family toxin [Deltaproteobacteria bacterium]MBW1951368.1 BrnT family toxin [Deltaproteobacteria bacterium]MBW2010038.1 BrnT family toxin [Deltaproteobacteria bacterium]MBW2349552.1 BrnT family toxin [Deltaproteobacteria bacterium]RLB35629.1 MAG: BrnT family toxin [Deltaproteobacteria bacterium]
MIFEWNEEKSRNNERKHGIDFQEATRLWDDKDRVEIKAPYPLENRYILIGRLGEKNWTAIYTMRGAATRIISVRRSRKKEIDLYEENRPK